MVGRNSKVWEHYDRVTEYMVSCKYCHKSLSSKHTSSNLLRHLFRQHKSIAKDFDLDDVREAKSYKRPMEDSANQIKRQRLLEIDEDDSETNDEFDESVCIDPIYEVQLDNSYMSAPKEEAQETQYIVTPGTQESTELAKKFQAETRYYNEMALLARSRRRLVDLQAKKLEASLNN